MGRRRHPPHHVLRAMSGTVREAPTAHSCSTRVEPSGEAQPRESARVSFPPLRQVRT